MVRLELNDLNPYVYLGPTPFLESKPEVNMPGIAPASGRGLPGVAVEELGCLPNPDVDAKTLWFRRDSKERGAPRGTGRIPGCAAFVNCAVAT
jgi:hypothetical protein